MVQENSQTQFLLQDNTYHHFHIHEIQSIKFINLTMASQNLGALGVWTDILGEDGLQAWFQEKGNIEHAIAYGFLFCPTFQEYDDRIYLGPNSPEKILNDWNTRSPQTSPSTIQSLLNKRFPLTIFPEHHFSEKISQIAENTIIYILLKTWSALLYYQWPHRKIILGVGRTEDGAWISFWEP